MREQCLLFGEIASLVGVITRPDGMNSRTDRPALILCNAGLVHRVGPHRLHVHLARRLAEQGFTVVRFDLSGLGDSLARADNVPYPECTILETQQVMDQITAMTGIEHYCLMGLSSGALLSLKTALRDDRVVGAGILNPHGFVRSSEWHRHVEDLSASRIYAGNLFRPQSWLKALTGKTNYRRLLSSLSYRFLRAAKQGKQISAEAENLGPELEAFLKKSIHILLLFSGADRSIDNFSELLGSQWEKTLAANVQKSIIEDANHTFANPVHQQRAIEVIENWMLHCWPDAGAAGLSATPDSRPSLR
jgi:alpha-beta hydrolase superfamily lysophospholipase